MVGSTAWTLAQVLRQRQDACKLYQEFLRAPSMSAGVYVLQPGQQDPQKPHREDELYFVIQGKGRFHAGNDDLAVESGSILFVPAEATHFFHSIVEELVLLVLFSPAETE